MKTAAHRTSLSSLRGQWLAILLGAVTLFVVTYHAQASGKNENPGVIPPQAIYRGLSYGEWGAELWKALLVIPVGEGDDHPYFTGEPFVGPAGMVFLIFPFEGSLDVTIPAGSPVFCAVLANECSTIEPPPWNGANEAELRTNVNALVDESSGLFAEIDGVAVKNIWAYRAQSPLFEFGPLPAGNLFDYTYGGVPAGTIAFSVAAGVYLMLPPLSVGTHTIHAGATYPPSVGFSVDGAYNITVVPK